MPEIPCTPPASPACISLLCSNSWHDESQLSSGLPSSSLMLPPLLSSSCSLAMAPSTAAAESCKSAVSLLESNC